MVAVRGLQDSGAPVKGPSVLLRVLIPAGYHGKYHPPPIWVPTRTKCLGSFVMNSAGCCVA